MRDGISCRSIPTDCEASFKPGEFIPWEEVYSAATGEFPGWFAASEALTWNYCVRRATSRFLETVTCRLRGNKLGKGNRFTGTEGEGATPNIA